ncbi:ubiquinone biosynthesis O-methyltransferase, mitochondrial-like [Haliotis rubra]|uniref:ubiquinone biosynthesis O-methyltransferase, mitochondrial-like n=1 Tax=Haliotis rubra TaxID=36100 RepID=UPI001EE52D95|nr:ubiquinone biosynthesis O-methyltransferase, mitochondrial-like [Haliotis rubra]
MSLCKACQKFLGTIKYSHKRYIKNKSLLFGQAHARSRSVSIRSISTSLARLNQHQTEKPRRVKAQTTIDEEEVEKFSALSQLWWDESGEFEALHTMNELRVPLIRDALMKRNDHPTAKPLAGCTIVDVGSGGGILAEPLARLGAFVIGVEASEENIKIAQAHIMHDPSIAPNVKYIHATVEDLVGTEEGKMDAVVASEVVEHVADAPAFLSSCCKLVKPGGSLFITTLNKTYISYMAGVMAAERLFRLVSPGTHDWNKFIDPQDLQFMLTQNDMSTRLLHGMMYNPLTKRWSWMKDTSINYAIHAVRADVHTDKNNPDDTL